jgi:hypothetical protein
MPDPDPRDGHLWTVQVSCRGASAIQGPGDAEPRDHAFADYEHPYRTVQVQAHSLPAALRAAANLPLAAYIGDDEDADAARSVTTVRVMAMVETHPYQAGPVVPLCKYYLRNLDAVCGHDADHAVHRVEELSDDLHQALLDFSISPAAAGDDELNQLWALGFIALGAVTPRGRAWLEAHRA